MTDKMKPTKGFDADLARVISDGLAVLCLPHSIIVDCHGNPLNGGTEHLHYRVVVRKKHLSLFWIRKLGEIGDNTGTKLLMTSGFMEFR